MSTALTSSLPSLPVPAHHGNGAFVPIVRQVPTAMPYRFTVAQVEAAIRAGILTEQDRCELIRGELIDKMVIGDPHMAAVKRLVRFFKQLPDERSLMGIQDAIKLADSRPEPDFTLLVPDPDCYEFHTPTPPDILLLVEVADSTLAFDRQVKRPLYAENGIRDFWIVNLVDDCLEIHRQPQADGRYLEVLRIGRGDSVAPLLLPDISLTAETILGPPPSAVP